MNIDTKPESQDAAARMLADIGAAVATSNLGRARELANLALGRGMRHPVLFNALGLWLQQMGRHQQALEEFRHALQLDPRNVLILNAIGLCLLRLDNLPEAARTFETAIAIDPNSAQAHYRRGLALGMAGDHDKAKASYERAIELEPDYAEAIGSLSSIAARNGDAEQARMLAERALQLDPKQPTAKVALAIADNSEKKFVEAETRLRAALTEGVLSADARPAVLGLLGDALDGQKRYAEAFAVYSSENAELRRLHAPRFVSGRAADSPKHLATYFDIAPAQRWKAPDDGGTMAGAPAQHVFLLGFMRSGTTLLEQVLASNPKILALEEKGLLSGLGETYMTSVAALDSLSVLNGNELTKQRQLYWNRVRQQGLDVAGKIFVDKQPLNTMKLPIIAKLFPRAKILFAVRDPRDVVFSCYRRHFKVNVTMFEFLALEDAARLYAGIMNLAEIFRKKLSLDLHEHYYEDMVADFEKHVRATCAFIGAEWTEEMRNFNRHAPAVDLRSPSATQVRRPLYGEGIGQWRSYKDQLAPIFPILRPWVERFGYPSE